jgi:hypothetical protein
LGETRHVVRTLGEELDDGRGIVTIVEFSDWRLSMNDTNEIRSCVERYYASLRGSDPAMVREVFHDNAKITGYLPDGLHEMSVEDFAGFVEAQQPSPDASGEPRRPLDDLQQALPRRVLNSLRSDDHRRSVRRLREPCRR